MQGLTPRSHLPSQNMLGLCAVQYGIRRTFGGCTPSGRTRRRELEVDGVVLLCLGRWVPLKGIAPYLDALRRVLKPVKDHKQVYFELH